VTVEPVTYEGKRGVRVTIPDEARRRLAQLPAEQQAQFETLALIEGTTSPAG
jgi:hypothetical protein